MYDPTRRLAWACGRKKTSMRRRKHMILKTLATCAILSTVLAVGCDKSSSSTAATIASPEAAGPAATNVAINGAGSTFVNPLMSKWSSEYQRVVPTAHVNYQSIGSGGGIRQLLA